MGLEILACRASENTNPDENHVHENKLYQIPREAWEDFANLNFVFTSANGESDYEASIRGTFYLQCLPENLRGIMDEHYIPPAVVAWLASKVQNDPYTGSYDPTADEFRSFLGTCAKHGLGIFNWY